jgi:phage terminase large subunit
MGKDTIGECETIIDAAGKIVRGLTEGLNEGKTILSLQGSARSGKTFNILIFLISYITKYNNTRLSIVRKTLPALKGSVLIDFKEIMFRMNLWNDKMFNKTELIYKFYNGSWVEFFSTDDEQKIRGRKRGILFANEANELSYLEWQQLLMRTTVFSVLDYNPSFSEDHWIEAVNKDPDTYHFISTYLDNPFLEQKIVDDIEKLKDKNRSLWTVYGLGLRAVIEGRIFDSYEIVEEIPKWINKQWVGMDFGYTNDPTAIVNVAINKDDLYIDEICYRTRMLTNDIINVLKKECVNKKIISESADPRLIVEIHNAGLNIHAVEKFQGSIMAGITKMQEYHIKITKRSIHVKKEIDNYVYDQDRDGRYLNQPVDEFNHAIDATRYVILTEVLAKNRKSMSINELSNYLP